VDLFFSEDGKRKEMKMYEMLDKDKNGDVV